MRTVGQNKDRWLGCSTVPANTVRWTSALLNTAVQFHTPKQSRAPVSTRVIDWWHRWGERGCRRWTLRTLPQPQLSCQLPLTHRCQLLPRCSRQVKENSTSFHLKLAVSLCVAVSLPRSPPHVLFRASTHVSGRQNHSACHTRCKLPSIQRRDLITRPDPPFSPALPRASCQRSQSASTCISCTVILKLQSSSSHPQFVPRICAGLLNPCLCRFVWGLSFLQPLPIWASPTEKSSSDISPPQLWLSLLLLGPAGPNQTSVPFWYSLCHYCRLTFTSLRVPKLQEQPKDLWWSLLIS